MIIVIDGLNASSFQGLLRQVYTLRARVFKDRLGWDVKVRDGQEYDEFDSLNPTQIVSVDDAGHVVGAMRLLQTTGPNMLADVFNAILDGEPAPRSPLIWEATRFCVDADRLARGKTRNSISFVTSEIMVGAFEYAQTAGVTDAVAVIDPVMNRVMCRSANTPYDYLGKPTPMGKVTAMAALMDCSDERIARLRDFAGIEGDVFMSETDALAQFGDAALEVPQTAGLDLAGSGGQEAFRLYCAEMLCNAPDNNELRAALRLIAEVETGAGTPSPQQTPSLT